MRLKDKVAIVTGGARGIGEAIVRAYVAEGARVVIADIEIARAEALAAELGGKALAIRLDVRDTASIDALVAATVSKLDGIDILVNNAGVFNMGPLSEITSCGPEWLDHRSTLTSPPSGANLIALSSRLLNASNSRARSACSGSTDSVLDFRVIDFSSASG